jgi:multidrug efflux pump subunit AcrA (membrane-fusion protein)
VPEVAIGYDQLGPYVLVVDEKNIVQRVSVKLGTKEDNYQVVDEGLKGDEWVIVNGLLRAIPGKQVTPEKETLPEPGGEKKAAPASESRKAAP